MDGFKELVLVICIASLGLTLYKMLSPNKAFDKQLKFLISLYFLFAVLSPFLSGKISFALPANAAYAEGFDYSNLEEKVFAQLESSTAKNIEGDLTDMLAKNDITAQEISVDVNISKDYSISINEIQLVLNPGATLSADEIKALVEKEVGENPNIIVEFAEVKSDGQ